MYACCLQEPEQTRILIVTLPETTPVLEATRLQENLERAEITPFGWVVNSSLSDTKTTHPILAARAVTEAPEITRVHEILSARYAVVPQANDPVGADRLRGLMGSEPVLP
ncbi:MAG: ArsA-related P-loop ATPase [Halomonas sp.]|uniref:ArsA-related P-loop ATPase n=1 Tax=Halomonas sp. TaxID=1486246 RepID=UPI002ACE6085|nr:ArsA-related P-loop ATPase [Halomonas sp.]MDZ7852407.1 ArsA-related P-loop ATPase [Halomonas sp.]